MPAIISKTVRGSLITLVLLGPALCSNFLMNILSPIKTTKTCFPESVITVSHTNRTAGSSRGYVVADRAEAAAWEDSMEMNSVVWWTHGFEKRFAEERGYDIRRCLPFLVNQENGWAQQNIPYGEGFESVNRTLNIGCNEDYRVVLQHCYEDYVQAHVEWSHERGLEYSNQPAYNLPLDMVRYLPTRIRVVLFQLTFYRSTPHASLMRRKSSPSVFRRVSMRTGTCLDPPDSSKTQSYRQSWVQSRGYHTLKPWASCSSRSIVGSQGVFPKTSFTAFPTLDGSRTRRGPA